MSIEVIQLSNYIRPQIKEVYSKEWVLNGDKIVSIHLIVTMVRLPIERL
jgi:hypothetical protein